MSSLISDSIKRKYLSPDEYSLASGLSIATVHRYLKAGKVPFVQPAGPRGRILIPVEAIAPVATDLPVSNSPEVVVETPKPKPLAGSRPKWRQ